MEQNQVRIVSDGTPRNTHVYDHQGKEIEGVRNVVVSVGADQPATVKMEVNLPCVDMVGELPGIGAEMLAKALHEAGRAAVEAGNTVAAEKFGEQTRKFLAWDEITEPAREGRRIQARWLLDRFHISPRPIIVTKEFSDEDRAELKAILEGYSRHAVIVPVPTIGTE
jgi:hypothetical protein